MSNANDALADLGLDLGTDTNAAVNPDQAAVAPDAGSVEQVDEALAAGTSPVTAETAPAADKVAREEVAIAEIETGFVDFIPAQKRGGTSGSKYDKIETLAAPVAKEDGLGFKYAVATIKPEDASNFDAAKLTRSVQSAVTAANRAAKDSGAPNRYITRRAVVEGAFVGVNVFRVDGTLDTEAEDAAAS